MEVDQQGMTVLDPQACEQLLRTVQLGRVSLSLGALPMILPVTFGVSPDGVILRVGPGAVGRAARDGQVVCFEADHLNDDSSGWSVCVIGQLTMLHEPAHLARAEALGLRAWSSGPTEFARLVPQLVTGRSRVPVAAGLGNGSQTSNLPI